MKKYNFKLVKNYIVTHFGIKSVRLGIKEDWFWTAETVYESGKFIKHVDGEDCRVGGIRGSSWGTPVMRIEFANGDDIFLDAYTGESEKDRPESFSLGPLSGPVQEAIYK